MGVSGLFRNIVTKYPNSHFWSTNLKIDYLFLDFNCLIYKYVAELLSSKVWDFSKQSTNAKFEEELVSYIIKKTSILVNETVKPRLLVYIAIDGVPPVAKMNQQKERRYKKILINELIKKYLPGTQQNKWDTNLISPGTNFMKSLCDEFEKQIKDGLFKKINVIFSGSSVPGEAEHKFLPFLDRLEDSLNIKYCIYSQDADQIVLAFRFPHKHIYIMRPVDMTLRNKYPNTQEDIYLDIKKVTGSLSSLFDNKIKNNQINQANDFNFMYDVIFLTFLEGNDFVKPIYFLKYKDDYLRTLLGIYRYQREHVNNNWRLLNKKDGLFQINFDFFLNIFERLSFIEQRKIEEKRDKVKKKISFSRSEELTIDNLEHLYFYQKGNPYYTQYMKDWNKLNDSKNHDEWKKNYYNYFFGKDYNLDEICLEYLKVLVFNIRYYFGEEIYWQFQYDAFAAPMPSDVFAYLQKNPNIFDKIKIPKSKPIHPLCQLAFILPSQSLKKGLIPIQFSKLYLKELSEYFPKDFDLKLLTGDKIAYAEPDIKYPKINELVDIYNQTKNKFTKEQKERDIIKSKPLIILAFK